nr:hypothetical protein [Tanacetum cinerariifolium]
MLGAYLHHRYYTTKHVVDDHMESAYSFGNEVADMSLGFPVNLEPSSSLRAIDVPSGYLTSWDFYAQKSIGTSNLITTRGINMVYMHTAPFGHVGSLSLPFTILNQIPTEVKVVVLFQLSDTPCLALLDSGNRLDRFMNTSEKKLLCAS